MLAKADKKADKSNAENSQNIFQKTLLIVSRQVATLGRIYKNDHLLICQFKIMFKRWIILKKIGNKNALLYHLKSFCCLNI